MTERKNPKRLLVMGIAVTAVFILLMVAASFFIDGDRLLAWLRALPAVWLIAAFFVLPTLGAPLSLLLLAMGLRFGFAGAALWVVGGLFFHLLVALVLGRTLLRRLIIRRLERNGYHVPEVPRERWLPFTFAVVMIPGFPYPAKNFFFALSNVSPWLWIPVAWLLNSLVSLAFVALGGSLAAADPVEIGGFIVLIAVLYIAIRQIERRVLGIDPDDPKSFEKAAEQFEEHPPQDRGDEYENYGDVVDERPPRG